jgi:hydroxypyruvate reductase
LAVAIAIEGRTDVVFAALGTDGIDGPTDAAGAIVDGTTTARIRAAGIDPEEALARCDSNPALIAAGDAVRIGATGTNVGDLWMVWRAHHG